MGGSRGVKEKTCCFRGLDLRLAFERLVNAAFEWQRLNERLFECLGHFPAFGVAFKCCVSNGRLVIAFGNCVYEALSQYKPTCLIQFS